MMEEITDSGIQALAAAGCGKNLTSLDFECEHLFHFSRVSCCLRTRCALLLI